MWFIDWLNSWIVPNGSRLEDAGLDALAEAVRFFDADIYDPPRADHSAHGESSRRAIESMLRACGWTWEIPYSGDGQVEWCGIFAGACWVRAGLKPDIAKTWFPSTYRLVNYARYRPFDDKHKNPRPSSGPHRLIADLDERATAASLPFVPRRGDIMIIGPSGVDKHITLIDRVDGAVVHTLEGNGNGMGPDGKRRQGVVRGLRALGMAGMRELGTTWHARHIIRPAPGDLG